jgi:voltage-gated potassium channel Kch
MFSYSRFRFFCSLAFFLPAVLANVSFIFSDSSAASLLFLLTTTLFLSYATYSLLQDVFSAETVDTRVLLNAINAYLLIAMTSAMIHGLISIFIPDSYNFIDGANTRSDIFNLVYFSVVTLTTLGYGDYLPLSDIARSFVAIEALIGQIYMAVIIARLVGLHSAKPS